MNIKEKPLPSKFSVMVVEDDPLLSDLLIRKLQLAQFETHLCGSGEDAVSYLMTGVVPSLIILDLLLPGIDGLEVLKIIRASEHTKNTPVLVFSNMWQEDTKTKALTLGATKVVVKISLPLEDVVTLVKSLCTIV